MKKVYIALIISCCYSVALGQTSSNPPVFSDPTDQNRYQSLIQELRCVVCQNEDLAESTVPLAVQLRHQIALKIQQQQSDAAIKTYLSARYGEFILFKPSFSPKNYLLWGTPFLLLVSALIWLSWRLRLRQNNTLTPLSHDENQQLTQLTRCKQPTNPAAIAPKKTST